MSEITEEMLKDLSIEDKKVMIENRKVLLENISTLINFHENLRLKKQILCEDQKKDVKDEIQYDKDRKEFLQILSELSKLEISLKIN